MSLSLAYNCAESSGREEAAKTHQIRLPVARGKGRYTQGYRARWPPPPCHFPEQKLGWPSIHPRTQEHIVPQSMSAYTTLPERKAPFWGNHFAPLSKGVNSCLGPLFPKLELELKSDCFEAKIRKSLEYWTTVPRGNGDMDFGTSLGGGLRCFWDLKTVWLAVKKDSSDWP